MQQRDRVVI